MTILQLVLCGFMLAACAQEQADSASVENADAQQEQQTSENNSDGSQAQVDEALPIPPGPEIYMGRRIARTMHYAGAPWLIRDSREREEDTKLMLDRLGVERGITICDVGCGNGFYSLQLAEMVGPDGLVIGVDIQQEMLDMLQRRADEAGIKNIRPVLGTLVDPNLEPNSVDLALLVDVYHEFSHPEQMLAAMRRSLKEQGRVVLLEFRAEDPAVPIKPLHKMSKDQMLKEMKANGFRLSEQFDGLPWQHMMTFVRDPAWKPEPGTPVGG